jgi:protoporphyrinogen oxidase
MLFKKRPRRKDVLRSYTLKGGLGAFAERVARLPGVSVATGRSAERIERAGAGWAVTLGGGERIDADVVAIATPPRTAARLLGGAVPEAAARIAPLLEATVETTGVVVRADKVAVPYSTFLIPRGDIFHSVVTRDVVPDPTWRGFVFHFRPGHSEEERLARIAAVLGVPRADLADRADRRSVLPSPVVGHRDTVAALDAALAGTRIAVCGNWFGGLAIEDCAQRARAEWQRVGGSPRE